MSPLASGARLCPYLLLPKVTLGGDEQSHLESLVRAHSTPQALVFRCRLILRVPPDHPSNFRWPRTSTVTAIPWAGGAVATLRRASVACKMRRVRVDRGAFPPAARLDVMAMATRKPARYHCAATRWSLDDLVAALPQRRT